MCTLHYRALQVASFSAATEKFEHLAKPYMYSVHTQVVFYTLERAFYTASVEWFCSAAKAQLPQPQPRTMKVVRGC